MREKKGKANACPKKLRKTKKADAIAAIMAIANKWESSIIPRSKISEFSGGLYSPGYIANLDCLGIGIEGSFKIGRQKCYTVPAAVKFLIDRLDDVDE